MMPGWRRSVWTFTPVPVPARRRVLRELECPAESQVVEIVRSRGLRRSGAAGELFVASMGLAEHEMDRRTG
jgi:hypothetical protein